ncbi:hypothetical protein MASR2M78_11830 [Treponema sp.]
MDPLLLCAVQFYAGSIEAETLNLGLQSTTKNAFDEEAELQNRLNCTLKLPLEGLSLRSLYAEQRTCMDIEDIKAQSAGLGLYHQQSRSRLLYGALDEAGLQKRISKPFSRKLPYNHERSANRTDLDTDASFLEQAQFHAAFSNANKSPLRILGALTVDKKANTLFTFGFEQSPGRSSLIRLETAFRTFKVEEREADTWFSREPPLPARELRCGAFSFLLDSSAVSFAGDFSYSGLDARGKGAYGNLSFGLEKPNISFDLSIDGASPHYTGINGEESAKESLTGCQDGLSRLASKISLTNRQKTKMTLDIRSECPYFLALPQKYEVLGTLSLDEHDSGILFALDKATVQWKHDISDPTITSDALQGTFEMLLGPLHSDLSLGIATEAPNDNSSSYTLRERKGRLALVYSWKTLQLRISGGLISKYAELPNWDAAGSVYWTSGFSRSYGFNASLAARIAVQEKGDPVCINLTARLQKQF